MRRVKSFIRCLIDGVLSQLIDEILRGVYGVESAFVYERDSLAQRLGFLPDLSIVDLLFNMGPESIFYL